MIMKNILNLLCLILIVLADGPVFGQTTTLPAQLGPHQWTMAIKVVGEDDKPIAGANVSVQYDVQTPPDSNQPEFGEVKGVTDDNGMFAASHTDSSWDLGFTAEKPGYYGAHWGCHLYLPGQFNPKITANGTPTFTLMLKKIVNPIPMDAKRLNTHVPALDKPIGFDLMAGDWVGPYGKGTHSDILFTGHFDKRSGGESDFTLTVSFPNPGDGIQGFTVPDSQKGSALRSPTEAPAEGYRSQWVQTDNRKPGRPIETNRDPNRNYFFRVRTVLDENGNVKSALYGKVYGDFMEFSYYLNPKPNDRDIEFDPSRNLLDGLSFDEQVRTP